MRDKLSFEPTNEIETTGDLEKKETKDGLPVISGEEYWRLYKTDVRAFGASSSATWNFRGYVRGPDDSGGEKVVYKDVLATNGMLKSDDHKGIHVGIDGFVDCSELMKNHNMQSPDDVLQYVVFIEVPSKLQEELGVVCKYESCFDVEGEDSHLIGGRDSVAEQQAEEALVVARLRIDPKQDPLARVKVQYLNLMVVEYIESGKPLSRLKNFIQETDDTLVEASGSEFSKLAGGKLEIEGAIEVE